MTDGLNPVDGWKVSSLAAIIRYQEEVEHVSGNSHHIPTSPNPHGLNSVAHGEMSGGEGEGRGCTENSAIYVLP